MLVDTSVWVDHLRVGDPLLMETLDRGAVVTHPFVIGELACGTLRNRREVLSLLGALPTAPLATPDEVLAFLERQALAGRGIGYLDVHILASAALAQISLWTRDRRLHTVAVELGLAG